MCKQYLQDRNVYDNGSSPTVSTTSVFIVAAIAASENRAVATIDFAGAFLNNDMPLDGDHAVLMRLNKYQTNILVSIDKSYQKYVNEKGTVVLNLRKHYTDVVTSESREEGKSKGQKKLVSQGEKQKVCQ